MRLRCRIGRKATVERIKEFLQAAINRLGAEYEQAWE